MSKIRKILGRVSLESQRRLYDLGRASTKPKFLEEEIFDELQAKFSPRKFNYDYDWLSLWIRASERGVRVSQLLKENGISPASVLESGCGDGSLGCWFLEAGFEKVVLTDMEDWRCERAREIEFHSALLEEDISSDIGEFDLVVSYNSFEHFSDPKICLDNLLKKVRVGGMLYVNFGPLYNSPWGMHAYRMVNFPYPQFLFGEGFLKKKIKELGVKDLGGEREDLQPMNGWSLRAFEETFYNCDADVSKFNVTKDYSQIRFLNEYKAFFKGKGLTFRELTSSAIEVVLIKK